MSNPKNDKPIAFLGTVVVHLLVLLVLFLMAFRTPLPLPGEEGVEVDLGMYNQGMGQVQPDKPAIPEQAAPPKPHDETNTKSKDDIVTQDSEETPSIKTEQKKDPKEETVTKPKEQPEKQEDQPTVNERALFKGSNKSQDGGSEGNTGQPGDQGNPNGLAGVKKYDGQGGQGNGPGYDLGGRGAKSLQRPSKDFPEEGHIVVEIWVDREGNVVRTNIAKGTDIANKEMRNMAQEAAMRSKFAPDPSAAEEQKGTITYTFVQNQ